ncbi:MAG TPA: hypothetical protein VJR06_02235 [Nitrososphaerales archaeon]|nr:hypothetical protein [Nitrososphaerales archaeon]
MAVPILGNLYTRAVRRWPKLANLSGINDGWRVERSDSKAIVFTKGPFEVSMDRYHGSVFLSELLAWERLYMPKGGVEGKTILDVGAGSGETALFYFGRGAKMLVCVEPSHESAVHLKRNIERNHWNASAFEEPFSLSRLSIPHDFLKFDAEGAEAALLSYGGELGPSRIEIHPGIIGRDASDAIVKKFGLTRISGGKDAAIYGKD